VLRTRYRTRPSAAGRSKGVPPPCAPTGRLRRLGSRPPGVAERKRVPHRVERDRRETRRSAQRAETVRIPAATAPADTGNCRSRILSVQQTADVAVVTVAEEGCWGAAGPGGRNRSLIPFHLR